ncbi:helicase associated domain-containing protein [Streptomyces sp. NPDC090073]|uniref:helicase associated domain-containing protein n=1 Tax=Streptomyces sp. NPDC090073 TaxID=3365936 RepID=UPI0038274492
MDLIAWPSADAVLSAPRRAGLAAAIRYHTEHGHLKVPLDYTDAYGYRLGSFIDGQRTAHAKNPLTADWISELENLGMIWDAHEAAWQGHMTTVEAFHTTYGHLAIPTTTPGGQFLTDQRALARKHRLPPDREAQLTALDADWTLPHGPDWHRKYHLLRRHIEAGHDPATLHRDTMIDGVKAGSWLHRQFTTWHQLTQQQRDHLTPPRTDRRSHPNACTHDDTRPGPKRSTNAPLLRTDNTAAARLRGTTRPSARCPGVDRGRRRACHDRPVALLSEKRSQLMREILRDDWPAHHEQEAPDLSEIS